MLNLYSCREYIRKNIVLFGIALTVLAEILCIWMTIVFNWNAAQRFESIKEDSNVSSDLGSLTYSFWDQIWKSGEAMSTYAKIKHVDGNNQNNTIIKLVKDFFSNTTTTGSSSSTVSPSNVNNLKENFYLFNTYIQLCIGFMGTFLFTVSVKIMLLANLLWRYLLISERFNFYKLAMSLFLGPIGFFYIYFVEKDMDEEKRKRIKGTSDSLVYNWLTKKINNPFNRNSTSENVLVIKNLFFSFEQMIARKKIKWRKIFNRLFLKNIDQPREYILKDVNLTIKRGSFNIIIGPNGSGKTTLIKTIVNLYNHDQGEIFWNDQEISGINKITFAQYVSYIPQILNLQHSITIPDFLKFARYPYRNPMVETSEEDTEIIIEAMRLGGCDELCAKTIDELSGGERQRVLLTSVLAQKTTEVIVLDEPTSFLDVKNQHRFLERLKQFQKQGKTIIMILHDLQQAINYADNLIVMKDGQIYYQGHPKKIVTKEMLKNIFSIDCDIVNANEKIKITNISAIED